MSRKKELKALLEVLGCNNNLPPWKYQLMQIGLDLRTLKADDLIFIASPQTSYWQAQNRMIACRQHC